MIIRSSVFCLFFASLLLPTLLLGQEYGKASYYANEFDGGRTFFGETYDKDKFTAAHKVHPQGTRLKVTRQDNGKSVIVRVNDRGPYVSGRIIELSYAAARKLGMVDDGLVDVKVEVLSKGSSEPEPAEETAPQRQRGTTSAANNPPANNTSSRSTTTTSSTAAETTARRAPARQRPAQQPTEEPAKEQTTTVENRPEEKRMVRKYESFGLFEIKMLNVRKEGFGVQVASFSNYENTLKRLAELQGMWFENIIVSVEKAGGNKQYKLILGPFTTREKANSYLGSLRKNKQGVDGFVVDLSALNYE